MKVDRQTGLGGCRPNRLPHLVQHGFGSIHPVKDNACGQTELGHPHQLGDGLGDIGHGINQRTIEIEQYRLGTGTGEHLYRRAPSAAVRIADDKLTYSRFIDGLTKAGLGVDRKIMADLAMYVEMAKAGASAAARRPV